MASTEVTVCFYGTLARLAGGRQRTVTVTGDPPTVRDLRKAVARAMPDVAPHLAHTAVGMGAELFDDDAVLRLEGEISLLPPVSGGAS